MTETTIFVGLDVHKKTIAVATVEGRASADVRFYGTIANTPEAIRSMLRKLGKGGQRLHLAYEAGPLGYNLYRLSTGLGHRCDVVAPSLIPRKAGDKVKTDRRDAMMLAQLLRAGQLTEVWVPDEAHEAMRDLVRMRAQAMKDLRKTRQQLHSFLLRHGRVLPRQALDQGAPALAGELTVRPSRAASRAGGVAGPDRAGRRAVRSVEAGDRRSGAGLDAGAGRRCGAGAPRRVDPGGRDRRRRGRQLQPLREPAPADGVPGAQSVRAFERCDHQARCRSPRPATVWRAPAWSRRPGPTGIRHE